MSKNSVDPNGLIYIGYKMYKEAAIGEEDDPNSMSYIPRSERRTIKVRTRFYLSQVVQYEECEDDGYFGNEKYIIVKMRDDIEKHCINIDFNSFENMMKEYFRCKSIFYYALNFN